MKIGSLDPVSNRETFQTERQMVDTETNEAADLTDGTIVFEIFPPGCTRAVLSATTDNGKVVILGDNLTYQVTFDESEMHDLCAETYNVGVTFERDGITSQVIIGTLPVLNGNIS